MSVLSGKFLKLGFSSPFAGPYAYDWSQNIHVWMYRKKKENLARLNVFFFSPAKSKVKIDRWAGQTSNFNNLVDLNLAARTQWSQTSNLLWCGLSLLILAEFVSCIICEIHIRRLAWPKCRKNKPKIFTLKMKTSRNQTVLFGYFLVIVFCRRFKAVSPV